jgi:hypothetical protein
LVSVAALAFTAAALATHAWFAPQRYLLPGFVCGWLAGIAFLDHLASRIARRAGGRRLVLARMLPLVLVLALVGLSVPVRLGQWEIRNRKDAQLRFVPQRDFASSRAFCGRMHPDALVVSPNPWSILFWCGNAGYHLPPDLDDPRWIDRYLDEIIAGYVIASASDARSLLASTTRLQRLASHGGQVLLRVRDAPPGSRPWRSTGPLAALRPEPP